MKKSGKEFIEAVSLGNEVVCRMGTAYLGDMYYQGFHPTSTCGTMGAAVSAAKLMGLDVQKTIYAQGIAGSMVAGLMAWNTEGSFTKRLQAGHPAMNAVIAARMASKGYNGPSDIFESKDGLLHAYSYLDHYDSKFITEGLGEEWTFAKSSIKVYPCCRYSGGHIDACLEIVNKYHPNAEDIEKIDIRTAVIEAVDECIAENVLSEFLKNHREEVITVSIYEYDEEGHLEIVKEEGRQLGIAEGEKLGIIKGEEKERSNGIKVFIKLCKDMNLSDEDTINKLVEDYQLSRDEAINAIKNY